MKTSFSNPELRRLAKFEIIQMLDAICQAIEPTETQYNDARERYETIGGFLAEESSPLYSFKPMVYPQGSIRTRTATRAASGKEFDVDLVCEFMQMPHRDPKVVKRLVWERFQTSDRYREMAVEKNRCVQIQYAGNFHMDVMPCIPGQPGWNKVGSVWVPDKKLSDWIASNPIGLAHFVESAAAKKPSQRVVMVNEVEAKAANVEPLPAEQSFSKPALLRIIQILKRHRDLFFSHNQGKAPISVIITTLATHSYIRAVDHYAFESVYDLLLMVLAGMPGFIQIQQETAKYWVANPSQPEENFAEKWNNDPALAKSFFMWHRKVTADIKALAEREAEGLDNIGKVLEESFGAYPANHALRAFSNSVKQATKVQKTGVTAAGIVVPAGAKVQTVSKVQPHNFHGS